MSASSQPQLLLIGASRGLGLALAQEYLKRGWRVVATERGGSDSTLHDLAKSSGGRLEIETVDILQSEQIAALRTRLGARRFEMLFVNAGTANKNQDETIAQVSTEEFIQVMLTNALGPMRVIETLQDLVDPSGLIGVMSSGQGSIGNNTKGGHEVYRGTKAALNMYMRSYAARHAGEARAWVLMAPGWIRTELGGSQAPFSIEESIPKIVDVLLAQRGKAGLQYLDREGRSVPW
jgi:NAD(P)-dependent dehydrogenase (short-subunit alcohol dehydrogenase family)